MSKRLEDDVTVPESGRFQHSHLGRIAHVGQPDEEASHSRWGSQWLLIASSHLQVRRSIQQLLSNSVFLFIFSDSTITTRAHPALPDRCPFWWHHPQWTEGHLSVPIEKLNIWVKTIKSIAPISDKSTHCTFYFKRRHVFQTIAILASMRQSPVFYTVNKCQSEGVVRCHAMPTAAVVWEDPVPTCPILSEFADMKLDSVIDMFVYMICFSVQETKSHACCEILHEKRSKEWWVQYFHLKSSFRSKVCVWKTSFHLLMGV